MMPKALLGRPWGSLESLQEPLVRTVEVQALRRALPCRLAPGKLGYNRPQVAQGQNEHVD